MTTGTSEVKRAKVGVVARPNTLSGRSIQAYWVTYCHLRPSI